jgi:hypothetical protein
MTASGVEAVVARRGGRKRGFALALARLNRAGDRRWSSARKLQVGKRWWRHGLYIGVRSGRRRSNRAGDRRAPPGLLVSKISKTCSKF